MNARARITLVLLFFSICGTAALLHHYTRPPVEPPSHRALYAVVFEQVQAMRADDFGSAYMRASREVRHSFSLPGFREMAKAEYPALMGARGVQLGPVRVRGERAFIEVYFTGNDREVIPCIYSLIREGATWKIDGVKMLPHWPAGVRLSGVQA